MRRKDNVSLWPWHLTLEVTAIVGHTRLGTVSEYQVQILVILRLFVFDLWAIWPTRLRLITWPYDLDLWPWRSWHLWLMRVIVLHPYTRFEVRRLCHSMCVSIIGPGDPDFWPFDLETGIRVTSKMENLWPFGSRIIRYVRDGRTGGRTDKSNAYCLLPYGRGGITSYSPMHDENRLQQRFINVPSLSTFGRCH